MEPNRLGWETENMKKLVLSLLFLATGAHLLYWGNRYRTTPASDRSPLILLGPLRSFFRS